MEHIIKNDRLVLCADTQGAELHELNTVEGLPLLWDGKPDIWPRHAPVCFPWCGEMDGGWYETGGKQYHGADCRHGFVRTCEHELIENDGKKLRFSMNWPGDRERWPWMFRFETEHSLEDNRAVTTCTVTNCSDQTMPVQFGYHPALRCPFLPGTALEEYQLCFENKTVITLHPRLFDMDSICFPDMGAWARLEHIPSGKYVQVDTAGYPYVLIWSKPHIPGFVCIEPWQGYPGPGHDLMSRPGTQLMEPGQQSSWKQIITACL